MKRKLIIVIVIVVSIALTAGVVNAAVERDITIKKLGGKIGDLFKISGGLIVNSLQVKGTTSLAGAVVNPTANKPVIVADDLRIDGRVWRGATAGTGDTSPFIINDNLEITGNTTVNGATILKSNTGVTGNLTVSGTVTAATLQQLVGGAIVAAGKPYLAAVNTTTTWTGTIYDVCTNTVKEHSVTVTFTPASETTGTWTSNPHHVFRGTSICTLENKDENGKYDWPLGTYSGSYKIVGNVLLAYGITKPSDASSFAATVGASTLVTINGNTITFTDPANLPQIITVLTKQ